MKPFKNGGTLLKNMKQKTGFISLIVDQDVKDTLDKLARKENRTKTYILEQALRNYFKSKRITKG